MTLKSSTARPASERRTSSEDPDEVVEAVLRASRVLVGVAARSLDGIERDVTLPQFRALVILASRGPLNPSSFAEFLGVHSSTATRMCDRLVAKGLVERRTRPTNRREVVVRLSARGRRIVEVVTLRRREEIATIVEAVPKSQRTAVVRALRTFGDAAGEPPDAAWSLAWTEL
jgi:DNA-binding MarR family transcriptional regulator